MEKYNKPFILVIKTAVLLSGIFGVSNCIAKLVIIKPINLLQLILEAIQYGYSSN
jgi:hypothetical protein